jgi:tetratricopeptide (TPR) repeat protein
MHEHPLGPTAIERGVGKHQVLGVSNHEGHRQPRGGMPALRLGDHYGAGVNPDTATVRAHHYTEAGLHEQAAGSWQRAGRQAA